MKIEIKNREMEVIFEHTCIDNTIKNTVEIAVKNKTNLTGAYLVGADLTGANLGGANFGGANLTGANLTGSNLTLSDLEGADLTGANLGGANLTGANLIRANLECANLGGANLGGAYLGGANLGGANLTGAYLGGAYLGGANLGGANLTGSNLTLVYLYNVIGNMIEISSMQIETYRLTFTSELLQIGCRIFEHHEWFNFRDEEINEMDSNALVFWKKYKDFIFKAIELKFGKTY